MTHTPETADPVSGAPGRSTICAGGDLSSTASTRPRAQAILLSGRMSRVITGAAWACLLVLAMAAWIDSYALLDPDEGRNAGIAREMAASGDYLVPHLNALPHADKPFLYYSTVAGSLSLFGHTEFAARLPSVLFTLLTAIVVGEFARRLLGARAASVATAVMLATPLSQFMAKVVIPDSLLTLFMAVAIMCFYFAVEARARPAGQREAPGSWRWWCMGGWTAVAAGVLTKGPVAIALPLLIAMPYGFYRRSTAALVYPPALAFGALIVTPWVLVMNQELPGFLRYVLVTETWHRIASDELRRTEPSWYFVPILFAGLFPWGLILVARAWTAVRGRSRWGVATGDMTTGGGLRHRWDHKTVFLLLWLLVPVLFFSVQHSKLPHYMLPVAPAAALLVAAGLPARSKATLPGARGIGILYICIGVFSALTMSAQILALVDVPHVEAAPGTAWITALALVLAGAAVVACRGDSVAQVMALSLPLVCFALSARPALQALGDVRSARELAAAVREHGPADMVVVGVEAFPPSLAFYLDKPLIIASDTGRELTGNFVAANYENLLNMPGSTLRPSKWWLEALATCPRPYVFALRNNDSDGRAVLQAAGVPALAGNRKYTVFGPCRAR